MKERGYLDYINGRYELMIYAEGRKWTMCTGSLEKCLFYAKKNDLKVIKIYDTEVFK